MKKAFINGKFLTPNGYADMLVCEDEKITYVGEKDEALSEGVETVDLQGKFVLPGFNDSHMHFIDSGASLRKLDLRDAKSIEDVMRMFREYVSKRTFAPGQWIEAFNWNDFNWTIKRLPTRKDLDEISTEIPIVALRVCGHVCIVNSKALEMLGLDKNTPQPNDGGRFDLDEEGNPNGVLHEMFSRVSALVPSPDKDAIKEMILAAGEVASSKGLTSLQTDDLESIPTDDRTIIIEAYEELVKEGKLKVRVNEQCVLTSVDMIKDFHKKGYHHGYGNDYFRVGPLKIIGDGSLGGRTAWLSEGYDDDKNNHGIAVYPNDQDLFDLVEEAHVNNMPVAVHCIGDVASKQVLDALDYVNEKHPDIRLRDGIVHAQILTKDICERMAKNKVLAYLQPVFIQSDRGMAEDRLGLDRLKYSYCWKTLREMGVPVSMSTDCPVEDMYPLENIYSVVTGLSIYDKELPPWNEEECISVEDAVEMYTYESAYCSYEEDKKGTLEVGKLADMTVLDKNIFEVPKEEIIDLNIEMTIVGGEVVYERKI